MEYIILGIVLLGALYLLIRFGKTETECDGRSGGCGQCSRIGRPAAERLYEIDSAPSDKKSTGETRAS